MQRRFHIDEDRISLPKGTRVVLKTDLRATDGELCEAGTAATVEQLAYDSYTVRTLTGRHITCQRDQLVLQRRDLLPGLGRRQLHWEELSGRVIYSAVVGSVAWGLSDEDSDEDVKGVFLLPFDGAAGLWDPVDEIQDPGSDTQYWEVQKLVYQGLRGDANTLELLWSPHVRVQTELGHELVRSRRMFVSRNIYGTFGRYAMSQLDKMRAAEKRGQPPRWKHAYNLLRLLCSGIRWLGEGEPLIEVEGELRDELLAVKHGEVPLGEVLRRADALARELERTYQSTQLPEEPDYEAAHRFLLRCREHAAREHLAAPATEAPAAQGSTEVAPAGRRRFEIPEAELRAFLRRYGHLDLVVCSLVGSHSYGFPSRDSDFDLKAIHLCPADQLLGLDEPRATFQFLGDVDGLEIDFTSHEARGALSRLLRGDGNVLERILSPYLVLPTAPDGRLTELRELTQSSLSRRFHRHYAGFLRGLVQLYARERSHKIKTLLYIFRVALTGVHLLRRGELLADLGLLLELYRHEPVRELFALKEQAELATIDDDEPYLALVPALEQELQAAHDGSPLPGEPRGREALHDWLLRWRRR